MRPFFPYIPNQNRNAVPFHQAAGNLNNGFSNLRPFNNPSPNMGHVNQHLTQNSPTANSILGSVPSMLQHAQTSVPSIIQHGQTSVPSMLQHAQPSVPSMLQHAQPSVPSMLQHAQPSVPSMLQHAQPSVPMLQLAQPPHGGFTNLQAPNSVSGFPMNVSFGGGLVAQNSNTGPFISTGPVDGLNPNAGFMNQQSGVQSLLQSLNQLVNMQLLNPSQLNSLSQMAASGNQLSQGLIPQNPAFVTIPQQGLSQQIGSVPQPNMNQFNLIPSLLGMVQPMQLDSLASSGPGSSSLPQQVQPMSLQANYGNRDESNVVDSKHAQSRHFKRDFSVVAFNPRNKFQKTKNQHAHAMNGSKRNERNNALQSSANEFKGGKRRSLAPLYTQQEIQQWREQRRKHYPTKTNVEKKQVLSRKNSEDAKNEAQLRRQQLKEILAKQTELGFEVPEIPSHYLSDSEAKGHGKGNRPRSFKKNERFQKGPSNRNERFQNLYNNKRKRCGYDRTECSGKSDEGDENLSRKHLNSGFKKCAPELGDPTKSTPVTTRKLSLLEKLLEKDMKREKNHLLQAFRFMVKNSFFDDQFFESSNELNFPKVALKEDASVDEVGCNVLVEELDGGCKDINISDDGEDDYDSHVSIADGGVGKADIVGKETEICESEEGEVTD